MAAKFWLLASSLFVVACIGACSGDDELADDDDDDVTEHDSGADVTVPPKDSGPVVTDAGRDAAPDASVDAGFDAGGNESTSVVLINEISGGDEWIELVNSSGTPFDLGNHVLADRDKTTGEPKLDEAVVFPEGTQLAAHAYLLVRGGGIDSHAKPCPGPDAGQCFHAEFGISNKNGETLFLIDPAHAVIGKVVYPANASQGAFSYSRLPDADPAATFATVKETPGAANAP